jgi:hypothetical protein
VDLFKGRPLSTWAACSTPSLSDNAPLRYPHKFQPNHDDPSSAAQGSPSPIFHSHLTSHRWWPPLPVSPLAVDITYLWHNCHNWFPEIDLPTICDVDSTWQLSLPLLLPSESSTLSDMPLLTLDLFFYNRWTCLHHPSNVRYRDN